MAERLSTPDPQMDYILELEALGNAGATFCPESTFQEEDVVTELIETDRPNQ